MSIGAGIVLIAIGAILSFAVDPSIGFGMVNVVLVGYVLMAAGAVTAIIGLILTLKKRKSYTAVSSNVDNSTGERVDRRETVSSPPTV